MFGQPNLNCSGISLGPYHINCSLEATSLRVTVRSHSGHAQLAIKNIHSSYEAIALEVEPLPTPASREPPLEKVGQLEEAVREIQKQLRLKPNDKDNILEALLSKEEKEIGRLQSLNSTLREKLLEKE